MTSSHTVDCAPPPAIIRTRELKKRGWSDRRIRAAVAAGEIVRLRDGAFCTPHANDDCQRAVRMRARLTGVSEMRRRGVFVIEHTGLDVHIPSTSARLKETPKGVRVHRDRLLRVPHPDAATVEPIDAVVHAVLVQQPCHAVATLDSALHHRLIDDDDLDELFAALPRRFRVLRRLIDRRAESGSETLVRLILRTLGCAFDCQVSVDGVGRVDLLVDGWLIIECDSEAFHAGWRQQKRDRRRDQAAAARGMATYRPIAEDVFWHPDRVRAAVEGLLKMRTQFLRRVRVVKAG